MWCDRADTTDGGVENLRQPRVAIRSRAIARARTRSDHAAATAKIVTTLGLIAGLLLVWGVIVAG